MSEPVEPALPAAVGKRLGTDEPLTEHDVAERLSKAALRLLRLLTEFREAGMVDVVKHSRYCHGEVLQALAAELRDGWAIEPRPLPPGPAAPDAG